MDTTLETQNALFSGRGSVVDLPDLTARAEPAKWGLCGAIRPGFGVLQHRGLPEAAR